MFRSKSRIPQGDGEARARRARKRKSVGGQTRRSRSGFPSRLRSARESDLRASSPACTGHYGVELRIGASLKMSSSLRLPSSHFLHRELLAARPSPLPSTCPHHMRNHVSDARAQRTKQPLLHKKLHFSTKFPSIPHNPQVLSFGAAPPPRQLHNLHSHPTCEPQLHDRAGTGAATWFARRLRSRASPEGGSDEARSDRSAGCAQGACRANHVAAPVQPQPQKSEEAAQVSLHGFEHENRSARVLADYSSAKTASNFESALHRTSRNLHPSTLTFTPVSFSPLTRLRCLRRARIIQAAFVVAQEAGASSLPRPQELASYPRRLTAFHRFREPFSARAA